MASFRFNFLETSKDNEEVTPERECSTETNVALSETSETKAAKRFHFVAVDTLWIEQALQNETVEYDVLPFNDDGIEPLKIFRHSSSGIDSSLLNVETNQTDIVPGVYEGGLKVWECSIDLCNYLATHSDLLMPRYCLELGCGHALPACLILRESLKKNFESIVMFTDYNDFVLKGVTIANIALNTKTKNGVNPTDIIAKHAVLGYGDWIDMSKQLCDSTHGISQLPLNGRFDLILAAETTYTTTSAQETAMLLARHLVPETGVGLVATKRYYFGVGGGSDALREAARKKLVVVNQLNYLVHIETVQVYEDGTSNIRDLLKVTLRPAIGLSFLKEI